MGKAVTNPKYPPWTRLEITFQDAQHAEFALWRLATDGEVLAPQWLRDSLQARAIAIAGHYAAPVRHEVLS
jgi:hypothetical protein